MSALEKEEPKFSEPILSLDMKTKVVQNVNRMSENIMSVCQYVRMQLFSLCIKMKVVQNVIMMSDSQKIVVRKFLWTAKESALVNRHLFNPIKTLN